MIQTDTLQHPTFEYGGRVKIDRPIFIRGAHDYVLNGNGCYIEYHGPKDVPAVVEISSAISCTVKHLRIVDYSGAKASVLISNQPGMVGSSACVLDDVRVLVLGDAPGSEAGFAIDSYALGGKDGNNDLHQLRNCQTTNHSKAGLILRGTQVHNIVLDRFSAVESRRLRYPVGILAQRSGYFTMRDCNLGYCSTDIVSEGPEHRIVIDGFNGEQSKRFFRNSHAGAESFLNVKNVRWDGLPESDSFVVDCFGTGPFTFENGYFAGTNGVQPRMSFNHYGEMIQSKMKKMYGSLSMRSWQTVVHSEIDSASSDVVVPREWDLEKFGCVHRRVGNKNWARRDMDFERAA